MSTFSTAALFRADEVFPSPMLKSAAGLIDAHRRCASAVPETVVLSCLGSAGPLRLSFTGRRAAEFICATEDILGWMSAIDQYVYSCVDVRVRADAVEHHEGLGAVIGRMAFLYTESFSRTGTVLGGLYSRNRVLFARECRAYEALASDVVAGRRRLPQRAS
jgi:hypothetical protein